MPKQIQDQIVNIISERAVVTLNALINETGVTKVRVCANLGVLIKKGLVVKLACSIYTVKGADYSSLKGYTARQMVCYAFADIVNKRIKVTYKAMNKFFSETGYTVHELGETPRLVSTVWKANFMSILELFPHCFDADKILGMRMIKGKGGLSATSFTPKPSRLF